MKKKFLSLTLFSLSILCLSSCNLKLDLFSKTTTTNEALTTNSSIPTSTASPTISTSTVTPTISRSSTTQTKTSQTTPIISTTTTSSTTITGGDEKVELDSIQNMAILHAWNWKLNDIKSRLSTIKSLGYGAIQLSPMQVKVDKNNWSSESTSSQWWKLYQPLAYKIASENESFLGTKAELTSLCIEAKKQGIRIVMDVVLNHLSGDGSGYNTQVYTKYPLHTYGAKANDNNGESVVKGHIDLPDIDTSNENVQADALALLKDYLDCGVTGFRFDAAKHIETPDDGAYSSNFWPTIINGSKEYAKTKGYIEPYYYGEVLNTPGAGRSFSSYTKLMSICDNKQGSMIINAVKNKSLSSLTSSYNTGENPNHLVLWAESHDTYANTGGYDLTTTISKEDINKAYIIQSSRNSAATLYFARPTSMSARIGTIDDNTGWKNNEVASANKFHNLYVGEKEAITKANNCFINVRGEGANAGACIINFGTANTAKVTLTGLVDGTYVDLISKTAVAVVNGEANLTFNAGASILIPSDMYTEDINIVDSYTSSVVLKNYDTSKSYAAWVWNAKSQGRWVGFNTDCDALGINLDGNDNYIIVEFNKGSSFNWDNKIRQTYDLVYSGSQIIYDYSQVNWK